MPVDEARKIYDREAQTIFGPVEPVASVEDRDVRRDEGGIRVRIYRPAGTAAQTLVYFHGGGWVVGSIDSHDGVARHLCRFGRCVVISVDYRRAPEHRFPSAVEDAWTVTRWAARSAPLVVGGDSAGGNLAAAVALRARDRGVPLALQLLVYPALDCVAPGHGEYGYWVRQYLRRPEDANEADASPLQATDLGGVAPALLLSCELDILRAQAEDYARRLREASVKATHVVYPGLMHGAFRMPAVLTGARRMLDDAAGALLRA